MTTSPPSDADIDCAAKYLQKHGCTELDRHWPAPDSSDEVSIIAAKHSVLVIGTITLTPGGPCLGRIAMKEAEVHQLRRLALAWADAHGARYEQVRVRVIMIDGIYGLTDGQEVG
jgi:Holliday junction resolvase-like predicted endonuclease